MTIRKTSYQRLLMGFIIEASTTSHWLDFDQLYEKVTSHTGVSISKQALQCSLKALEKDDYVRKSYLLRRERKRTVIVPTKKGFDIFAPLLIT